MVDKSQPFIAIQSILGHLITVFGRERIVFESHPFFHNAFSLIDRSAWEECKFNENQNGVEDRFWAREQTLRGKKIVYDS